MMQFKQISDNEIYLFIKYIKSVLCRVEKSPSYIEDARCLKVNRKHWTFSYSYILWNNTIILLLESDWKYD